MFDVVILNNDSVAVKKLWGLMEMLTTALGSESNAEVPALWVRLEQMPRCFGPRILNEEEVRCSSNPTRRKKALQGLEPWMMLFR